MAELPNQLSLFKSPLVEKTSAVYQESPRPESEEADPKVFHVGSETDDRSLHDNPQFHRHSEATNAELFYDLFFVANLTVFTNVHEVNDGDTLKQYIGFFCVLWFTWYQVGLYDVRFSMDSVVERIAKAIQFLVMIGFAIVGPKFNVGTTANSAASDGEEPPLIYFKALTITIMISRFVLVFQYLQSMYFTRHYKKTLMPMGLIAGTYFVAAFIYLGLFWSFHLNETGKNESYIAWYVVAILETLMATAVSSVWRNISFKGTHLVQRMSLLTLIILGEGVMGVAEKCQKIVHSEGTLEFKGSTVGNIICAVLILYFIYMIYFDWISEEHIGTIRQQIWSFLHFPLHLALVLAVEGAAQCITWRAAVVRSNTLLTQSLPWQDLDEHSTAAQWKHAADQMNNTVPLIITNGLIASETYDETIEGFTNLENVLNATTAIADGAHDPELAANAVQWALGTALKTVFSIAGFSPPANSTEIGDAAFESIDFSEDAVDDALKGFGKQVIVFELTFTYFYVAIGIVVMLCCVLAALSTRVKARHHWIRIGISFLLGAALSLLATIDLNTNSYANFAFSAWLLPTVTIILFLAVCLTNVKPVVPKALSKITTRSSRH